MKQFKILDIALGWVVFFIAMFVYASTAESAGSLWDCGEFISGCLKLQVVHPPGAPLFLMLGRLFSLLTPDGAKDAYFMNLISAFSTAGVVMFAFWITTGLAKRLIVKANEEIPLDKTIAILGAGLVAALACTFMDTLWFSAVEGEVYALSTFFMFVVLWGIMKWESCADESQANRWLVFISYMIGVSIGVHLLSLLVIPVAVLIYYLKKFKPTLIGTIISLVVGFVVLAIIQVGIIQMLTKIAGGFEHLFVNSFGLPFNSGVIFFYLLFIGGLGALIWYANKIKNADLQLVGLCMFVITIGFSSYAMVPIRAAANTPINMNDPQDAFSMLSYLNREQYGSRPLLWGPQFDKSPYDYSKPTGYDYFKNYETGKYEIKKEKKDLVYKPEDKSFFPRMWSSEENHQRLYKSWTGSSKSDGGTNWTYFFKYQLGYMYFRYFFWNFAGRQDSNQGTYDNASKNGNWLSGIGLIDNMRLGSQDNLPNAITREEGRNKYFLLPFLFGIIGLWYLINKNPQWALVNILLFGMTGVLLIVYSNQPPIEPRERDYVLVGSFVIFCIWIGMGVLGIYEFLKEKKVPGTIAALGVTILGLIAVPTVMANQGWDDHNRSGRFMARDFAKDFLESCPKNAILFTQGDNDTYPLWYAQEVEGIRPDVRVTNLSLLGVDWYIQRLQKAANTSGPLPFVKDFTVDKYRGDKRDFTQFMENQAVVNPNEYLDIQKVISFILSDKPEFMAKNQRGDMVNYLPTTKFKLKVNKADAIKYCGLPDSLNNRIVDEIVWDLGKTSIIKFDLAVLALVAGNDWSRPICFANTVEPGYYNGLDKFLIQKGMCYQFVPVAFPQNQRGYTVMDLDSCYNNIMNKFEYGGLDKQKMFVDENSNRLLVNVKSLHLRLADELSRNGQKEKSVKVLERMREKFTNENVPYYGISPVYYNYYSVSWIDLYFRNGKSDLAAKIYNPYIDDLSDAMRFFSLNNSFSREYGEEMKSGQEDVQRLTQMAVQYKDQKLLDLLKKKFPGMIPAEANINGQTPTGLEGQGLQ